MPIEESAKRETEEQMQKPEEKTQKREEITPRSKDKIQESVTQTQRPVTLRPEEVKNELTFESMVEVELGGSAKTGVIRWIGYVKDPSKLFAGLEMV